MKIWRFYFASAFAMERQLKSPLIFFRFRFRNDHVGQSQATAAGHTCEKQIKSQRFSFAFAFVIQQRENPKSWDFYLFSLVIVSVRMVLLKSIAIHLPLVSRYFCKSMPASWLKVAFTPPICISIRLPFASRCFCRSIIGGGKIDKHKQLFGIVPGTGGGQVCLCAAFFLGKKGNT